MLRAFKFHSLLSLSLSLALVACLGSREQPPLPSEILGPYTATGTVVGTGASLYRRGTHVLLMDGHPRFFLESKTIDLHEYEGKNAVLRGELFPNSHPSFLPVLAVESVTPLSASSHQEELQEYSVPALGLSLEAPAVWESRMHGASLTFTLSGASSPFLTIARGAGEELSEGLPVRVGGRNGMRTLEERTGEHRIVVPMEDGSTTVFAFTPQSGQSVVLRDAFYAMLRSVRFDDGVAALPPPEGPVIPCGGSAHVLCPENMFCEVSELDTGIGACRTLER